MDKPGFIPRKKSPWRILGVSAAVALAVLASAFLFAKLFFFAARNPKACTACHFMEPYYKHWQASSHAGVPCVECHEMRARFIVAALLKYSTGAYDPRPHADVKDAGCLKEGCHDRRLLDGGEKFKETIAFDHRDHMEGAARGQHLRCVSCHSSIVQGSHMAVDEDACFLCHFKGAGKGQSVTGCPSCHGTPKRVVEHSGFLFSHESYLKIGVACSQCHVEVSRGDGAVPEDACHECHVERPFDRKDFPALHRKHVQERGFRCSSCHGRIEHGNMGMITALEVKCENCHQNLHRPQKELYMGTGGKGVRDVPSRMFAAQVACDGCHIQEVVEGKPLSQEEKQESRTATRASCVKCHGEGYDLMLDDWEREIGGALAATKPVAVEAGKMLGALPAGGTEEGRFLLEDAVFNYGLVEEGRGAHNVEYSVRLLQASWEQVRTAGKLTGKAAPAAEEPELLRSPDKYCTALCHGRLGLKENVFFEEMEHEFPHKAHVETVGISCTECHSPERHKQRAITKEGCMSCHHGGDRKVGCEKCHPLQSRIYSGKLDHPVAAGGGADVMAEAGIECGGCHDLEATGPVVQAVAPKCVECHSEGYDKKLFEWEKELLDLTAGLTASAAKLEAALNKGKGAGAGRKDIEKLLDDAKNLAAISEKGRGVHNFKLMQSALKDMAGRIEKALAGEP